jgi:hypothetical protein
MNPYKLLVCNLTIFVIIAAKAIDEDSLFWGVLMVMNAIAIGKCIYDICEGSSYRAR